MDIGMLRLRLFESDLFCRRVFASFFSVFFFQFRVSASFRWELLLLGFSD